MNTPRCAPTRTLPEPPEVVELYRIRKQAKLLLKGFRAGDTDATDEVNTHYRDADARTFRLCDAQLVIARAYGFVSWPRLAVHVQSLESENESKAEPEPARWRKVFGVIEAGDTEKVLAMIDADESLLDVADTNNNTPLGQAFVHKNLELARQLIERGANVFAQSNAGGIWPVEWIVGHGRQKRKDREQLVEAVIAARAWDVEIFHAVWRQDLKSAREILERDPTQVSIKLADPDHEGNHYSLLPFCGRTPLHYAVIAGDQQMVRLLLEAGAEVDAVAYEQKPDHYSTPMITVPQGCGDIAELLIEFGANVKHSRIYLGWASRSLLEVLVAHGAAGPPLMGALRLNDYDKAVSILRDNPSAIQDCIDAGEAPLGAAVNVESTKLVDLLLDHGADLEAKNIVGTTVLEAVTEGCSSFEMVKLLVDRGADIHVNDDQPIKLAIWNHGCGFHDYESVIRYLVGLGCRPRSICHCTVSGNLEAVKLLVELGADVNETEEGPWGNLRPEFTALDYCTGKAGEDYNEDREIAAFLRAHGAKHGEELGL